MNCNAEQRDEILFQYTSLVYSKTEHIFIVVVSIKKDGGILYLKKF